MTVSSPPTYRNTRTNFYTDKASDNSPVGSIISTFKAITGVYDNSYIPLDPYNVLPGNSNTPNILNISILDIFIVMVLNII